MQALNSSGDATQEFRNPDGSLASWTETLSAHVKRATLVKRTLIGVSLACVLWAIQFSNGVLDLSHVAGGLLPIGICLVWGCFPYMEPKVRRYTTVGVLYTRKDRIKRAWKWWATGVLCMLLIWGAQFAAGQLAIYWWYAWPACFFLLVGTGLYLLKGEQVLAPDAAKAKSYFDAIDKQRRQARGNPKGVSPSRLDVMMKTPAVRYAIALLFLYGAYYFSTHEVDRRSGVVAGAFVLIAAVFAREVSLWLLGAAVVGLIGWALFAGIAALPLSAAVVIGALIIASALNGR